MPRIPRDIIEGRRAGGFTLVELLVTLAVVGILIAILVPAASALRRSSRQSVCATSLRVIGQAFGAYAVENRGYWPVVIHDFAPPGVSDLPQYRVRRRYWFDGLSSFLNSPMNRDGTDRDAIHAIAPGKSPFWGCPMVERDGRRLAYGMNPYPQGTRTRQAMMIRAMRSIGMSPGEGFQPARAWSVASSRALAADCDQAVLQTIAFPWWRYDETPVDHEEQGSFNAAYRRHRARSMSFNEKSINLLLADGHVEASTPAEVVTAFTN